MEAPVRIFVNEHTGWWVAELLLSCIFSIFMEIMVILLCTIFTVARTDFISTYQFQLCIGRVKLIKLPVPSQSYTVLPWKTPSRNDGESRNVNDAGTSESGSRRILLKNHYRKLLRRTAFTTISSGLGQAALTLSFCNELDLNICFQKEKKHDCVTVVHVT